VVRFPNEVTICDFSFKIKFNALVLPDFKTYFVNLSIKPKQGEGIKHFWENYYNEGYCLYYAKYDKYECEGTVLYKTSNLMNGFLQRLDHFRKHLLLRHDGHPRHRVRLALQRQGHPRPNDLAPQFEYYQKRELNPDDTSDRKLVEEFFCTKVCLQINVRTVQDCEMHK